MCMFLHVDAGVRFAGQLAFLGTEVAALHRAHTSGFSSALQQLSHNLAHTGYETESARTAGLGQGRKEGEGKCRVGSCCGH